MMMHLLTLFRHTNAKIAEKKVKQNGVSYQTAHQALAPGTGTVIIAYCFDTT